ncbi:MAG: DUF3300 domain-containing protein [Burkholderiales bacterium]|nr:DUF3300 domain-containing protein [Burkholderiales bacterium]
MTPILSTRSVASGRRGSPWTALLTALLLIAFAMSTGAQAPVAPSGAVPPPAADDLEKLVGRIALYPDDLVSIILPASTNPLQIVQADRFLDKRKADPKLPIDDKWDDAVKTLLNYPDVVKMMSADLDWTSDLGEAVVADQAEVLEAVQSFRRKAQAAGNLKSDDKQVVKTEKEIIIIEPADPQVIYVPQYNPSTVVVYGSPYPYGYYPTPYPSYYYPYAPGAALAAGVIWGVAIGAIWSGGRYGANYGGGSININRNTNINTGNINTGNIGGGGQRPGGGGAEWKSNKSPGQVSSSVGKNAPSARAGDSRAGAAGGGARASTGAAGGGARPSTGAAGGGARPSTGAAGGGASANRSGGSGGSAFSSSGSSGRQASANSSRGASSSRAASGGGGGRGGGGGGGGGGRRR